MIILSSLRSFYHTNRPIRNYRTKWFPELNWFWYIRPVRKHVVVIGTYLALTLLLTWPLVLRFGGFVAGDGSDDPALTWNLWWFKHAVLDMQVSPLRTDFMFYPIGINLVFYTLTLLNDALALPIYALAGLIPAANVELCLSFVLSGYGAFLLARYILRDARTRAAGPVPNRTSLAAPVLAGLIYAFSTNKMLYASLGQFNIASSQWIPFYILYLLRLRAGVLASQPIKALLRPVLMAALFLLLQAYAEFTFASFLVVFTVIFLAWHVRPRRVLMRMTAALAVMAGAFVLGFLPILVPMAEELRIEGDIFVQGSGFAEAFSADMLGFFVPGRLHPILGGVEGLFQFPYINFVFIGWLTLVLAMLGASRWRRLWQTRFWGSTTLIFGLLALGPGLRINGTEVFRPLPFALLQVVPVFNGNRYPSRYSVLITLGVAILAALGVQRLLTTTGARKGAKQTWLTAACAVGIVLEHLSGLPLSDYRVPSFYADIRAEPGDFTVLELPLDWRNGFRITGTPDKIFMLSQFYQTAHEKRMLSGNTSRNPELKFQYFTESPVINSLIALETNHELDAATLARDKQLAPAVMGFFGVRYIVVRPEAGDTLQPYLQAVLPGLRLWREENSVRVFRIDPQVLTTTVHVDPRAPDARLYFAEGWGEVGEQRVWAQRHETRLLLPLSGADSTLNLRLTSPADGQSVSAVLNGHPVESFALAKGSASYSVHLPGSWSQAGINDVRLQWAQLYDVRFMSGYGMLTAHDRFVVVKSAGEEVGDFAHIWIDGRDWSPDQRGYNYVGFNPLIDSFEPLSHAFDTFESPDASLALAKFLPAKAGWNADALAVRDEASRNLSGDAKQALLQLGVHAAIGWRWSHAFLRYTGPDLQVITREDASPIRPAIVSIGERITAPEVAGAVESIDIVSGTPN
jgi:hypothetical protein